MKLFGLVCRMGALSTSITQERHRGPCRAARNEGVVQFQHQIGWLVMESGVVDGVQRKADMSVAAAGKQCDMPHEGETPAKHAVKLCSKTMQ